MGGPSNPSDQAEVRAKRARIELLVRGEDGAGFETREVPSAFAYLESRPQRIPGDGCELARLPPGLRGTATYVLKNRRTEDYLLLTEQEKFLWERMDGRASLQEIGTAYVLRYGAFDFEIIPALIAKLRFWLTVVSHQLMHALACVHYKRRVREFGFTMLHGFIPTFYVDVTDIFMASRRARIVNALAGPLVHLVLASVCLWTASLSGPGLVKGFLAASAILQLQSFFVSLYPFCFLEMDGYHILVDLLGVPTLKHASVRFMRETLWSKLRRRTLLNRQEVACVAYFVLSVASIAGFVALNAWVLMHASRNS